MYTSLFLFALSWTSCTASPIQARQQGITPPSQDPFYQPPPGYESSTPGTILRTRTLPPYFNASSSTIQLLFRSDDSQNNSNAVVTTLLVPSSLDAKKLLSVQEPYNSVNVNCSPSYGLQNATGDWSTDAFIISALQEGWYVNVPDHEGFTTAFANGLQEGRATLNSIRAALASCDVSGLDSDATVLMQGYSGGSIASGWASELQPSYAPELNIKGAALGGMAPNATSFFRTINGTDFAGIVPLTMLGLAEQVPAFNDFLQGLLVPETASLFDNATAGCAIDAFAQFADQNVFSYFKGGDSFLSTPQWDNFVDEYFNAGLHGTPQIPLYVYKGVLDQVSPVADTDTIVNKYCGEGVDVTYVRNSTTEHIGELTAGEPDAFAWLQERMNGVPVEKGCNITTVD